MRIAGVPEHFNFPFIILSEKRPEHFQFLECAGGSGEMASLLLQSVIDFEDPNNVELAVMLPEAAYTFIDKNPDFKIFGEYTNSAITWGVYCREDSELHSWDDVKGKTFGISRHGSGSELMAYYGYDQSGWEGEAPKFKVVQNLEGAQKAFANKEIDVFLWEVQTTKALVDNNEWKQIGTVQGDWPGFVFVAHKGAFHRAQITFHSFFNELRWCVAEYADGLVEWAPLAAKRFRLPEDGLIDAINKVDWSENGQAAPENYQNLKEVLKKIGKIGQNNTITDPFH